MLHRTSEIVSEDFPGITIKLKAPNVEAWSAFQDMAGKAMGEAQFNLLIACGKIETADGSKPPTVGELCDEWPTLPELALGSLAEMAGTMAPEVNATQLDLPAILAAAERVAALTAARDAGGSVPKPTDDDLALCKLAEECARYGMTADIMRTIIHCNQRRGSYAAFLFHDVGAFAYRRAKFPEWNVFKKRSGGDAQGASTDLALQCVEFPPRAELATQIGVLPALAASSAGEIMKLVGDVRAEVKKGTPSSAQPAETR